MLSSCNISERWCIKFHNLIKVHHLKIGISENFQTSKACGNSNVFHTLLRIAIYACNCTKHLQILFCFSRIRPFEKKKKSKNLHSFASKIIFLVWKLHAKNMTILVFYSGAILKFNTLPTYPVSKLALPYSHWLILNTNTKMDLIYFFHAAFIPFVIFPRKRGN